MASSPQIRISVRKRRQNSGSTSGATISSAMMTAKPGPVDLGVAGGGAHLGVGTKRPVGRNSSVRISTTNETMIACEGLTQIEA